MGIAVGSADVLPLVTGSGVCQSPSLWPVHRIPAVLAFSFQEHVTLRRGDLCAGAGLKHVTMAFGDMSDPRVTQKYLHQEEWLVFLTKQRIFRDRDPEKSSEQMVTQQAARQWPVGRAGPVLQGGVFTLRDLSLHVEMRRGPRSAAVRAAAGRDRPATPPSRDCRFRVSAVLGPQGFVESLTFSITSSPSKKSTTRSQFTSDFVLMRDLIKQKRKFRACCSPSAASG